jgi:hypothetical protein
LSREILSALIPLPVTRRIIIWFSRKLTIHPEIQGRANE